MPILFEVFRKNQQTNNAIDLRQAFVPANKFILSNYYYTYSHDRCKCSSMNSNEASHYFTKVSKTCPSTSTLTLMLSYHASSESMLCPGLRMVELVLKWDTADSCMHTLLSYAYSDTREL